MLNIVHCTVSKNPEQFNYRYMYEKLSDCSDILDQHLEDAGSILEDWYAIKDWANPSVISQGDIWAYSQICLDTPWKQ
jgi:DNA polymerase alpha subunit B